VVRISPFIARRTGSLKNYGLLAWVFIEGLPVWADSETIPAAGPSGAGPALEDSFDYSNLKQTVSNRLALFP